MVHPPSIQGTYILDQLLIQHGTRRGIIVVGEDLGVKRKGGGRREGTEEDE